MILACVCLVLELAQAEALEQVPLEMERVMVLEKAQEKVPEQVPLETELVMVLETVPEQVLLETERVMAQALELQTAIDLEMRSE